MANIQLNVIVVGGGIGSLTSALALRRQGHATTVVECSAWLREAGAAVTVAPNCHRVLTGLGIDTNHDAKGALFRTSKQYHYTYKDKPPKFGPNGDGQNLLWADTLKAINLADQFYLVHRVDLHDALKNRCLDEQGPGKPVKVFLSSKVVAWDTAGTIKLSDGTSMSGDLIVAADGIRSGAHESLLGRRVPAVASGLDKHALYRCFAFYVDADRKRHILRYSCRDDELQHFGAYAWTENTDSLTGAQLNRADLLDRLSTLPPLFQALTSKTNKIYRWEVGDREPIPSYTRGRLVLVGDAAHPMWPRQGQGAAQSIEDGRTLGTLMKHL